MKGKIEVSSSESEPRRAPCLAVTRSTRVHFPSLNAMDAIVDPPPPYPSTPQEELGLELAQPMGRGSHLFDWHHDHFRRHGMAKDKGGREEAWALSPWHKLLVDHSLWVWMCAYVCVCVCVSALFLGQRDHQLSSIRASLHSVAIEVRKGSHRVVGLGYFACCAAWFAGDGNKMAPCGSFRTPSSTAMSMIFVSSSSSSKTRCDSEQMSDQEMILCFLPGYEVVIFQRSRTFCCQTRSPKSDKEIRRCNTEITCKQRISRQAPIWEWTRSPSPPLSSSLVAGGPHSGLKRAFWRTEPIRALAFFCIFFSRCLPGVARSVLSDKERPVKLHFFLGIEDSSGVMRI